MDVSKYKAGVFQKQFQYESFLPAKINHDWKGFDGKTQFLLEEANRKLGELALKMLFSKKLILSQNTGMIGKKFKTISMR
jgi:hypothetical protein